MKGFCANRPLTNTRAQQGDVLSEITDTFRTVRPLVDYINTSAETKVPFKGRSIAEVRDLSWRTALFRCAPGRGRRASDAGPLGVRVPEGARKRRPT